jgi:ankyrin repeat protein
MLQKAGLVSVLLSTASQSVLDSKAHVEDCSCCGKYTALMVTQEPALIKLLLAAGADVNITTSTGNTCLHVAAAHNYPASVICLLLKAGVNTRAVNSARRTAAQVAVSSGNAAVAALLNRVAQRKK